jgi:MFS family permease
LFWLLVLNRVLSGAAEACASGADEAMAYDSLPENDRESLWPKVLANLMRWQSGAIFFAMLTGAALFDHRWMAALGEHLGLGIPEATTRWPVFATLGSAVICLGVAMAMKEPSTGSTRPTGGRGRQALANILLGAKHVVHSPKILALILAALVCDSFVRLFLTFASNYNRLIQLPEIAYGAVGSGMALLGFAAAPLAKRLVATRTVSQNFVILFVMILLGLAGAAQAIALWGVWVVIPLGIAMSLLQFFVSHYLNAWTNSELRATVLSFRGVAMNLGYGSIGLAFAAMSHSLKDSFPEAGENLLFSKSLLWLPPAFLAAFLLVAATAGILSRRSVRPLPDSPSNPH